MNLVSNAYTGLKTAGLYGTFKSVIYSLRYTDRPDKLFLHSKTATDLDKDTEFAINNRFIVGAYSTNGTNVVTNRSKFITEPGSSISHTGENSATIRSGSVVHIGGDFSMGDSYINSNSRVTCFDEITIGDNVAISWNFDVLDDDRHQIIIDGERPARTSPIEIQDRVWIGHHVSVHKGVTINKGSVVASNSVVVSDVPPNTLVAGCPAEVVRENVTWE